MRKLLILISILCSLTTTAQWQLTGSRVRYVNGIGIPTRDTVAGVLADSSQILIRPADSSLYVKYKRTWIKVGGAGFTGSGTTNYVPKFTGTSAIGNSRIIDDGTLFLMGFTTSQTGIAAMQVNGGIFSSSSGYPVTFHSTDNTSYNPFYFSNTNLFGAIGNYSGLLFSGPPGPNDSIMTMLGLSSVSFASGGASERVRITRTGQVNIGGNFTSTNNTLQVNGNAAIGYTTAAPTNGLLVAGNVGVGTTSPAAKLTIISTGTGSEGLRVDGAGGGFALVANGGTSYKTSMRNTTIGGGYISNTPPTDGLIVEGNVGIGYTAPAAKLAVSGRALINTNTDNGVDQLQVNGSIQANGFAQAYTAKTTTYTATTNDYVIDCTSGTFTVNLFTAVGNTGRILIIKNSGTGTITVDPNGAQTIDGAATQSLATQWSRVHIISDGANWKIISN